MSVLPQFGFPRLFAAGGNKVARVCFSSGEKNEAHLFAPAGVSGGVWTHVVFVVFVGPLFSHVSRTDYFGDLYTGCGFLFAEHVPEA